MKKQINQAIFLFVFLGAAIGFNLSAQAETIVIVGDNYCPYSCEPNSPLQGIGVELATTIFTRAGYEVEYKFLPWIRAVRKTRIGKYNAIIGAYVVNAPDFIFPEEEMGISVNAFFKQKGASWTYTGRGSLNEVRIGGIIGYSYGKIVNAHIEEKAGTLDQVQMIGGDKALEINIAKLLKNRIDTTIEDKNVFLFHLRRMGLEDNIEMAGVTDESEKLYLAFSPAIKASKHHAKIFSKGIRELSASGELEKILDKYGVPVWKHH